MNEMKGNEQRWANQEKKRIEKKGSSKQQHHGRQTIVKQQLREYGEQWTQ